MKRMFVIAAGLAALCAGLYGGATLLAQGPGQPQPPAQQPAPAQTRVAVVNLHLVLKGYNKTKVYDAEVEGIVAPMRKQGEKIKEDIKKWTEAKNAPQTPPDHKEQYDKAILAAKRQLEDLEGEASKKVGKKREEQLVQLYREIESAVGRYAAANGFSLVLQYTDPEEAEKYTAQNIQRKLAGSSQTGCTVPMYFHPGLDISAAVIANLNASYPGTGTGPAPAVTPQPNKN